MYAWIVGHVYGEWKPCDVGNMGNSMRIVDSTLRNCVKADISPWITSANEHHWVCRLLQQDRIVLESVTFANHEVLKYERNGMFKTHIDRDRGNHHLGTLLVVAGSNDLRGGVLQDGTGTDLPISGEVKSKDIVADDAAPPYAVFIPLGAAHAVTEITSGTRVVLKASVHGKRTVGTDLEAENRNDVYLHGSIRSD
jgi:hypothetical protein